MTLDELLKLNRIELQNVRPGRHYTTCPECSAKRKLAHQKNKCLGVTIEGDRARWGCNHCGWTGPSSYGGNGARPPLAAHLYRDRDGNVCFRKVRNLPGRQPRFWLEHWDENTGWLKGAGGADTSILYRIDEVADAIEQARVIAVVEGEKDADNLWKLDIAATCNAHGASEIGKKPKWTAKHSEQLHGADIVVLNDNDAAGFAHAKAVCAQSIGIAKSVRRLDLKNDWPEMANGQDVSDWLVSGGEHTAEQLKVLIGGAPDCADAETPDEDAELERLARLPPLEYGRARKEAAKQLSGGSVALLEAAVRAKRKELGLDKDDGQQGQALYEHWAVEPWPELVDGGILLRALKEVVQRYVFMSTNLATAVALWIIFSWLHEFLTHSPLLYVTSAERDSGKSTLLGVLNFLVRRALQSVDISGPALFRSIAKWQPTLIVDEADDALADNPDLRSVINSGWTRGQGVVRCHQDTHEPELFSTFAPKIVAMKGRNLPDTTLSRSITITMKPRRASDPKEHAADFDHLDNETFARLRSQLMRFAADNAEAIAKATPEIPPGFHNRRRANWATLLAIAEACGGEWKTAAWAAAMAIEAVADTFDPSIGVELLRAIKAAFAARATDRIKSADLLNELVADATAPWVTYNKGKQISERQVAGLLKPYGIKPRTIRLDDGTDKGTTAKGYLLAWFTDVFARYCASATEEPPSSAKADDRFPPGGSASPTEEPTSSSPERTDVTDGAYHSSPRRGIHPSHPPHH